MSQGRELESEPSKAKGATLSFGVELEFPIKRNQLTGQTNTREQCIMHIANPLRKRGIHNVVTDRGQYTNKYQDWFVHGDVSANGDQSYGMELSSPIFTSESESEAADAITEVCKAIKDQYDPNVTPKCGLHVHVGKGMEGSFSDQEVINLFAVLWTFETRLDKIHPSHRHNNHYCSSMHETSKGRSESDCLQKIFGCQSKKDVINLVNVSNDFKSVNWAYEALRLKPQPAPGETIEFRQHEGTLEAEEILKWAKVCSGLVKYTVSVGQDNLEKFLHQHQHQDSDDEKRFTAADLICHIGLHKEASYYRGVLQKRATREQ